MALRLGLLLFAVLVLSSTAAHLCRAEFVLDADGDPVQPDTEYYMMFRGPLPRLYDNIDLFPTKLNDTYYVGAERKVFTEESKNVPVRFHPIVPGPVNVFDRGNLAFSGGGSLGKDVEESGFWTLAPLNNGKDLVATTGEGSWFMVTKGTLGYKLMLCPCKLCRMACSPVGIVGENGRGFLGVGGSFYEFVFAKKGGESNNHLRKYSSE